jgi:hypothetical protein
VDDMNEIKAEIMSQLLDLKFTQTTNTVRLDKEIIEKGYEYSKGVEIIE